MGRRKKTHEEFVAEVKALVGDEYAVVGHFDGVTKFIEFTHTTCGRNFTMRGHKFLGGQRCSHKDCKVLRISLKQRMPYEEFIRRFTEVVGDRGIIVSEFCGVSKKITVMCKNCESYNDVLPANIIYHKQGICNSCALESSINKRTLTQRQFEEKVSEVLGEEYEVLGEYSSSSKQITIRHNICGNVFRKIADKLIYAKQGCTHCSTKESAGERKIREFLSLRNIDFMQEFPITVPERTKNFRLDFLIQGVAIEYDGEFHYKPMPHAGGEDALIETHLRDAIKDKYCADNGIPLIRIPYWDFDNIDEILTQKLLPLLEKRAM